MKIFVYGVDTQYSEALCRKFGNGEYIDVTACYQDILALCADIVVINTDVASNEVVLLIREFEQETRDVDNTTYYYVNNKHIESWTKESSQVSDIVVNGKQVQI